MWARGPPTCTPPPLSPWGRQEAACPRVPGWGRGTGCGSSGRAWWGLGLGHTFSPRFSKPLSGLGCGMKRNRLRVEGGSEQESLSESFPEGHEPLLWVPHSESGPHRLEGTLRFKVRKRIGAGWRQQGERLPHILKSCYPSPGR